MLTVTNMMTMQNFETILDKENVARINIIGITHRNESLNCIIVLIN